MPAYDNNYFTAGKSYEESHGYLRFFPKTLKTWYFREHQPKLEAKLNDHARYLKNPKGLKILEIGTGRGTFLHYCGKENVIGIDMSKEQADAHCKTGFNVICHDASKSLPFKDETFDVVYSAFVIEHIRDGGAFVKEIARVLKRGGRAIIRTADVRRCGWWLYTDYTHVQPYTVESCYGVMTDNGFRVKELDHGITPPGFFMRRLANVAILLPTTIQDVFFKKICTKLSYEVYIIGEKI
ncbi:MAG: methyltransferase domain-containing protein [Candidatus Micrarchaeia archaeon]